MIETSFFTEDERSEVIYLHHELMRRGADILQPNDDKLLIEYLRRAMESGRLVRDDFGLNPILKDLQTALIVADEIGMTRGSVVGVMLTGAISCGVCTMDDVVRDFGTDVSAVLHGLLRVNSLYEKSSAVESENFRQLLVSFAEDMRVILIMIANRLNVMRQIRDTKREEARHRHDRRRRGPEAPERAGEHHAHRPRHETTSRGGTRPRTIFAPAAVFVIWTFPSFST